MSSDSKIRATPTLVDVELIMDAVETQTINVRILHYEQAGEFAADPVLDAAKELYGKLREAVREAALFGQESMQKAAEKVVETWDRLRDQLGEKASELLTLFQEQMWLLVSGLLSSAARHLPGKLDTYWGNELDTVAAKLAWSVSPSVRVAVDGWLAIAVGGGLELNATYKATHPESSQD